MLDGLAFEAPPRVSAALGKAWSLRPEYSIEAIELSLER